MHLSNQSLLVILLVGIVAGWLAGRLVRGAGFGLVGDLIVGIVGAFIGNWLLPKLGIHLGTGLVMAIVNASVPAPRVIETAQLAEHLGFDAFWITDSHLAAREAMAMLGALAVSTERIHLGTGVVMAIVNATVGAIVLLLVVRLLSGGGRWGGGWRRRW